MRNILVVGDIMIDRYWFGSCERLSPEAPVPILRRDRTENRLGGAANVANNLAALGCDVSLIGAVGEDADAEVAHQLLTDSSIHPCLVPFLDNAPTICKQRFITGHQQLLRVDIEAPTAAVDGHQIQTHLKSALREAQVIVFSDYAKGTLTHCAQLIRAANVAKKPVVVDPKGDCFARYSNATVITPNLKEFERVVGNTTPDSLPAKAHNLLQELSLDALLVTQGSSGMTLFQPNADDLHLPAKAAEVFDVTGAGDTVVATLAASLSIGLSMEAAAMAANDAAALVVQHIGTSTVPPDFSTRIRKLTLRHFPYELEKT